MNQNQLNTLSQQTQNVLNKAVKSHLGINADFTVGTTYRLTGVNVTNICRARQRPYLKGHLDNTDIAKKNINSLLAKSNH